MADQLTAGEAARWAWENRRDIAKALAAFTSGSAPGGPSAPPGILIIGPGGAGKTSLGKFLSGEVDYLYADDYEESLSTETYTLEGGTAQIEVPPGQQDRRHAT